MAIQWLHNSTGIPTVVERRGDEYVTYSFGHVATLITYIALAFDQFSGMYRGSSKQPDYFLRVDTDPSPRIIVESGWSESFPHLRNDKDLWLLGDPSVVLVILLRWTAISNGRIKGCAEVWRRDALGSLVSCTMVIICLSQTHDRKLIFIRVSSHPPRHYP